MKVNDSHIYELTIYYDGWCKFCSGIVGRLASLDRARRIHMVPLQSLGFVDGVAREPNDMIQSPDMDEVMVVKNHKVYTGAVAVIEIMKTLGGIAKYIALFLNFFPDFIIQAVYRFVARNRYRIFGRERCELPKV